MNLSWPRRLLPGGTLATLLLLGLLKSKTRARSGLEAPASRPPICLVFYVWHYSVTFPCDLELDPEPEPQLVKGCLEAPCISSTTRLLIFEDEPQLASESVTWRNPPSSIAQFLVLLPFWSWSRSWGWSSTYWSGGMLPRCAPPFLHYLASFHPYLEPDPEDEPHLV